jgi:hypothetical protein
MEWDSYKEVKAGEKEKTEIIQINEGKASDYRTNAYWDKVEDKANLQAQKDAPAIEIITKNGARMVINLPVGDTIFPASNLGLFKKTYGEYPAEGLKVTTKVDENGFKKIILEK